MKRYEFLKIVAREFEYLTHAARKLGLEHPQQAVNDVVRDMLDKKTYRQFDTAKGSVRSYVYGSVKNRSLGILRRSKYESELFVEVEQFERAQEPNTVHHRAHVDPEILRRQEHLTPKNAPVDPDTITDVRLAVGTLTDRQRSMVTLVYMGPESVESAAELLGISIPDAQEALRSAKEALRTLLADYSVGKPSELGG